MVLVLALLLTVLCGVRSASIPSNSLGITLPSNDGKLDKRDSRNLDKIRRTVLQDMKRLLDTQLATLFENAVNQKAGAQSKRLKLNTKLHPTFNMDTTPNLESVIPDNPQNSDLIKVLSDGSLQDPADEVLRNAVDQLLQEDEDKAADNIDNDEELLYNNEDQYNEDNSTKNDNEDIDENAFPDALLPSISANDKDRQKNTSNSRRGISHVIIEHVPKPNKSNNHDRKSGNILDLDEILKTAVKDFSGSQEDGTSKSIESEDWDSVPDKLHTESNQQNEPLASNFSQSELRTHDPDNNRLQIDGFDNVHIDEKEKSGHSDNKENYDNGEFETHSNSDTKHDFKTKHHKHTRKHGRNRKDRQPLNKNDSFENDTYNDDIHRPGNHVNKNDNDTKEIKHGENEDRVRHHYSENKHPNEKSRNIYRNNRNHHNIKHHSRSSHNKNHDKHKHHSANGKHHDAAKQHIIVRVISDSDGSNESRLDMMHDKKPNHENTIQSISSDLMNRRHQDSKEAYNSNLSTSRDNTVNEVKVPQHDTEDKNNFAEISNSNEKKNNVTAEDNNVVKEDKPSSKEEDENIEGSNVMNEESNAIDDEYPVTRDNDMKTPKLRKGNKEQNIYNEENVMFGEDENDDDKENDATKEIDNPKEQNKAETRNAEENGSEEKSVTTKKDKHPKKDKRHRCHYDHNGRIGIETDESNVIRDFIQNKEMKKSYSLSLTLSTK